MHVRDLLPRDAIPSVDDPSYGTEYAGADDDDVIVLAGTEPTAYPVRFLHYHEIVNATHDGRPVAVTWCPLVGAPSSTTAPSTGGYASSACRERSPTPTW